MPITQFVIPFLQWFYGIMETIAGQVWGLNRSLLLAGLLIEQVTSWLSSGLFSPLIDELGILSRGLMPVFLTVAMVLLGIGYVLAPFARIRVVHPGRATAWLLFAIVFYQAGPQLYVQGEQARRAISGTLYQQVLSTTGSGALSGLSAAAPPGEVSMGAIANQFGAYVPDDQYVDGLDVAMAYLLASGSDVVQPATSLPQAYHDQYFNLSNSLVNFLTMSWLTLISTAASLPLAGIFRQLGGPVLITFGILEQLIYLALTIAVGLLFVSMSIAVLFSLFQATEPMARTLIDMWLELFILSIVISVAQAIVVGFVVAAASSMNPSLAWGSSIIGSLVMGTLVLRAFGAIWGALGRFTGALGAVSGGKVSHVGELGLDMGKMAAGAALMVGTAGAGAGIAALSGASLAQVAGSALAGSDKLFSAGALASMTLPEGSPLKGTATGFYEGAIANRMLGPMGGLMLRDQGAPAIQEGPANARNTNEEIQSAMALALRVAPPGGYADPGLAAQALRDALGAQPNKQVIEYLVRHEADITARLVEDSQPRPPKDRA